MLFSMTSLFYNDVYALSEPILISISSPMKDVVFDGKWTSFTEWKPTSLSYIVNDDKQSILRTAHFENYVYIFIDSVDDFTLDFKQDAAIVCFEKNDNITDHNTFCFLSHLGNDQGIVLQENSTKITPIVFQEIQTPKNFIAISTVSDENDRYTKIPHPSFEFKIPTDLIGRSDNYRFFVSVYDHSSNIFFTYPEMEQNNIMNIPSSQLWGNLISPDKSLPELHYPIMIFVVMILSLIILQSKIPVPKF